MILSIIVAVSENGVIGRDNALIWRLSNDLKRFKALTTGHSVIMGRKTYESMGKPLPNRRNIVISRDLAYRIEGAECAASIEQALDLVAVENEVFIIGGGMIYKEMWGKAQRLYLTVVHTEVEGDTFLPEVGPDWKEISRESHQSDEKNEYPFTFIDYIRE